jgi:glycosyltransferase involved in cell wall biosynthesis
MHASAGLTVVVTTYESPEALDVVLWSLSQQSDSRFDIVVADDGSGPETGAVVERWGETFADRLSHVWQPDDGYRLALARNRGALAARGDYMVFLDGDCVPRRHFVRALRAHSAPGWFVAGRRLELSESLTRRVLEGKAEINRWSLARWFVEARRNVTGVRALTPRDRRRVGRTRLPDFEPENRAYGFLLGIHRSDFERVNGYDTRYLGWGEEDVDLALRLRRLGLRCAHAGPQATVLHLWHPTPALRDHPNHPLLDETERSDRTEAVAGLRELAADSVGRSL